MRILRSGVCALAVFSMVAGVSADDRRPPVILSAEVAVSGATLFVSGSNFGRAPKVRLNGVPLDGVVVHRSERQLTANMPALPPGTYRLEVERGYKWEGDIRAGIGTQVPNLGGRGIGVAMYYSDESLLSSHGDGQLITNVVCTNP